jgi:hypothetical protein
MSQVVLVIELDPFCIYLWGKSSRILSNHGFPEFTREEEEYVA